MFLNRRKVGSALLLWFIIMFSACREQTDGVFGDHALQQKKLAVTTFENLTGDPALADIGQMASEWIAQGLMQIEDVSVLTPSTVRNLVEQADTDVLGYLATQSDVDYVFEGSYYLDQGELLLKVRLVNTATKAVDYHLPDYRSDMSTPLQAIREVTERIMGYWLNRRQIEKSITIPPKYPAYKAFLRGMTYYEVDDSFFRTTMEKVLTLDPDYFEPYLFLAYSYYYNNYNTYRSAAQADSILGIIDKRRLSLTPYQEAVRSAAKAEIANNTDQAYAAFLALFNRYPDDPFVRYNTGTFALFSNHLDKAIEIFSGADFDQMDFGVNVDKRNLLFLFDALHQKGEFQRILDLSHQYLPDNRDYFYELVAHINLGNEAEAAAVFQTLDQQPDSELRRPKAYYYNILGQEYLKLNDPNSAKLCLQKSMQFAPMVADAINFERIFALFYLKAYAKGIAELKALLPNRPPSDNPTERAIVLNFLAYFYAAKEDLEEAIYYHQQRNQLPQQHYFYLTDAYLRMQAGDKAGAVANLKAAYQAGVIFEDISFGHHVDFMPLHGYAPFDEFVRPK